DHRVARYPRCGCIYARTGKGTKGGAISVDYRPAATSGEPTPVDSSRWSARQFSKRRAFTLAGAGQLNFAGGEVFPAAAATAGLAGAGAAVPVHRAGHAIDLGTRRPDIAVGARNASEDFACPEAHEVARTPGPAGAAANVEGREHAGIAARAARADGEFVDALGQADRGANFPCSGTAAARAAAAALALPGAACAAAAAAG